MTAFSPTASFPTSSGPTSSSASPGPAPAIPITVLESACFGLTTAGDVISRALKAILVEGSESPPEADEYDDAIDELNSYMDSLEADGLSIGFNRVCNVADIVTVPNGAIRGIVANLAIELAPMFGGKISQALIRKAEEGKNSIRRIARTKRKVQYPITLPRGSGNYCNSDRSYPFYSRATFGLLSIARNRIETEISVAVGAEKVSGFWSIGEFSGIDINNSGRVSNNTSEQITLDIAASFTLKCEMGIITAIVGIAKNGVMADYAETPLSTTTTTVSFDTTVVMEPGEFLEIVVADLYTTVDITLTDATVRLT